VEHKVLCVVRGGNASSWGPDDGWTCERGNTFKYESLLVSRPPLDDRPGFVCRDHLWALSGWMFMAASFPHTYTDTHLQVSFVRQTRTAIWSGSSERNAKRVPQVWSALFALPSSSCYFGAAATNPKLDQ
jgi:hypothetical protein